MLYSNKWLKEWVATNDKPQQIADNLTMVGLEVDAVEPVQANFKGVVVAKIEACEPHPNADKLRLCQVNAGNEVLQIVCGAPNARQGIYVALAKVGAELPNDFHIKPTKIRDVESLGMLCSQKELGLGVGNDGIMELPECAGLSLGMPLENLLDLDDTMIEVDLTPNRGDCLSIAGVAREYAAISDAELTEPASVEPVVEHDDGFLVKLEAEADCPRYCCRIIKGVDLSKPLPIHISERLRRMGVKSINPIVDLTNYVMFELGQPMHAFDLNKLDGQITVRRANDGESLTLLDGKEVTLTAQELVIADNSGAIALAGVMGGLDSGISNDSVDILLESAFFTPDIIMGKARKFGLHTDASHRYERGVDPFLQEKAINRLANLITEYCGGSIGPLIEAVEQGYIEEKKAVEVHLSNCERILGIELDIDKLFHYCQAIGCQVTKKDTSVSVIAPSYRFDLNAEHDFIEEVARIHGYDNIPVNMPNARATNARMSELTIDDYKLKSHLVSNGYNEVISYSFVNQPEQALFHPNEQAIELQNPISEAMGVMRLSLIPGLVATMAKNVRHQQKNMRLFEIGNKYFYQEGKIAERRLLGAILTGKHSSEFWANINKVNQQIDFYDAKGDLETLLAIIGKDLQTVSYQPVERAGFHPYQCADVYLGDQYIGFIGRVMQDLLDEIDVAQAAFYYQIDLTLIGQQKLPQYQEVSKYPRIQRDLAFVVNKEVSVKELLNKIRQYAGSSLTHVAVFDAYEGQNIGENMKSLAFTLTFQDVNKTLDDNDIDSIISIVINNLKQELNADLR